jgi:hypothetical protein
MSDQPPLPVNYDLGEPVANLRMRALQLADANKWLTFLWAIDPDQVDPSDLTYLVLIGDEGKPLKLRAYEVLPFVFGLAVGHDAARMAAYRQDLLAAVSSEFEHDRIMLDNDGEAWLITRRVNGGTDLTYRITVPGYRQQVDLDFPAIEALPFANGVAVGIRAPGD